jgi:hypothetical protein
MAALHKHSLAYIKGNQQQYLSFAYIIVIHGIVIQIWHTARHTNTSQLITFPWRNHHEWTSSKSLRSRLSTWADTVPPVSCTCTLQLILEFGTLACRFIVPRRNCWNPGMCTWFDGFLWVCCLCLHQSYEASLNFEYKMHKLKIEMVFWDVGKHTFFLLYVLDTSSVEFLFLELMRLCCVLESTTIAFWLPGPCGIHPVPEWNPAGCELPTPSEFTAALCVAYWFWATFCLWSSCSTSLLTCWPVMSKQATFAASNNYTSF